MFALETKLLIMRKQVIFYKITERYNSNIFNAAVTKAIGL